MRNEQELKDETQKGGPIDDDQGSLTENAGTGKALGLYGCGFILFGLLIVVIVMVFVGTFNPFEGTENIGP